MARLLTATIIPILIQLFTNQQQETKKRQGERACVNRIVLLATSNDLITCFLCTVTDLKIYTVRLLVLVVIVVVVSFDDAAPEDDRATIMSSTFFV